MREESRLSETRSHNKSRKKICASSSNTRKKTRKEGEGVKKKEGKGGKHGYTTKNTNDWKHLLCPTEAKTRTREEVGDDWMIEENKTSDQENGPKETQ